MLLLALDCSTSRGSVAVGKTATPESAGVVLWEQVFPAGRGHGGELFSTLREAWQVVADAASGGGERERLGKILVGLGPGSYSGVRQAIAVATGLSLAARAELAGLPSPLALETGARAYHAVGDARRGTFYYTAVMEDRILAGPELLGDSDTLLARITRHPDWPVVAVESAPSALPVGVETKLVLPSAARLLAVHPALHQNGRLEPIYLRPPAVTMPGKRRLEVEAGRRKAEEG